MQELDTFYLNKKTLNSGYIFVNNTDKVKDLKNLFESLHVCYTMYIDKSRGNCIYGFKVFRIKRRLFELCVCMKEVYKCF